VKAGVAPKPRSKPAGAGRPGGEIELEAPVGPADDGQRAAAGIKDDASPGLPGERERDEGGRERGVPAEVDLAGRREPPELQAFGPGADEECRLGKPVFRRDPLHQRVLRPARERDDPGGIAAEDLRGERVDPEERQRHRDVLPTASGTAG
jgi:hypothetical protein